MKVEVEDPKDSGFPKLMRSGNGLIVLFYSPDEGVVIVGNDDYPLGRYSESWVLSSFTQFKGKVILQND